MSTSCVVIRAEEENLAGRLMALPAVPGIEIIIDLGVALYNGKNGLKDWCYQVQSAMKSLEKDGGWPSSIFQLTGNRLCCYIEETGLASAEHDLLTAFMSLQQFASATNIDHPLSELLFPHMLLSRPSFDKIRIVAVWHEAAYCVSLQPDAKNIVGPDMGLAEDLLRVCEQKELVINGALHDRLMEHVSSDAGSMEMVLDVIGPCEQVTVLGREHSFYRTHNVTPGSPTN